MRYTVGGDPGKCEQNRSATWEGLEITLPLSFNWRLPAAPTPVSAGISRVFFNSGPRGFTSICSTVYLGIVISPFSNSSNPPVSAFVDLEIFSKFFVFIVLVVFS